ncbi:MAG: metallophosphoesterase [Candidatus Thermoplasmatota archaeon]|nr:metallophosphoesterase [Candidatus Thermoplasmatota archaeon]
MKFLHLSDVHLGHRQYNMSLRQKDMQYSFLSTINSGIQDQVDFVLLCGDLFHHKNVTAQTLSNAEKGLQQFSTHQIPVVLIQGNHDAKLYKQDMTWMEYLHRKKTGILLQADVSDSTLFFKQYDKHNPSSHAGFIDINNVRIFGLQYSGQQTSDRLQQIPTAIQRVNDEFGKAEHTILMGHFGVEGHIPGITGGVSEETLAPLRNVVDYVALGHLHKQYSENNWIFNAGSLEAHDTREATWDLGYYITTITKENGVNASHHLSKRRPFYKIVFSVDRFHSKEGLLHGFKRKLSVEESSVQEMQQESYFQDENGMRQPIIDLRLKGQLHFSRSLLDINELIQLVEQATHPVKVQPSDATESLEIQELLTAIEGGREVIFDEEGHVNRDRLEQAVFSMKAGEDDRFKHKKKQVAEILFALKTELLSNENPEDVAKTLQKKRRQFFPTESEQVEDSS